MNPIMWLVCCAIIIAAMFAGVLPATILGALAVCFGCATIIAWVGDHIPIWKTYIGGGVLLCMFGGSILKYFNIIPEAYGDLINNFLGGWGFLDVFICMLIVGAVMSIKRETILQCIGKYIPCMLAGLAGAAILAVIFGMIIFGKSLNEIIAYYVLPIMSGGSGAGALPLAQMFTDITGADYENYVAVAMATLTMGDLFAVLIGCIGGQATSKSDKLNGHGTLMKGKSDMEKKLAEAETDKDLEGGPLTIADVANAMIVMFALLAVAYFFNQLILPTILGAQIHMYAYMVIFAVILRLSNIVPERLTRGLVMLKDVASGVFVLTVMFCCGYAYTDLATLIECFTSPATIIICFAVSLGSFLGAGLVGQLVGFYPYEAGLTAGLCQANAGGAGDVCILSSTKRMGLMMYAQISSRIGNAIILIIASFLFTYMF